jgi:hypothetical protein
MDLRTSVSFDPEILAELDMMSREMRDECAQPLDLHRAKALWWRAQDVIASAALRVRGRHAVWHDGRAGR